MIQTPALELQKSNRDILTLRMRGVKAYRNRKKWKRFSGCGKCKSKLMAYLDDGHSFDEVIQILHKKHPDIKNIREYARHAVRSATGEGIWDDWIHEHNFWPLRSPLIVAKWFAEDPESHQAMRETLEEMWKTRAENGRVLIEQDKKLTELFTADDEIGNLLRSRVKSVL